MYPKIHTTGSRHVAARSAAWAGIILATAALAACGGDDGDASSASPGSGNSSQPLTPVGSGGGATQPLTTVPPYSALGGGAQSPYVTCEDYDFKDIQVAPKTVTIFNNAGRTIYPVLATSTNSTNQWIQACKRVNTITPTNLVYKLYVNQGAGIPSGSSVRVTLPLYSELASGGADQYITWWNGTRVFLADKDTRLLNTETSDPNAKDTEMPTPDSVFCTTGDNQACDLTTYSSKSQLPTNIYAQLSEFTFGDIVATPPGAGQNAPLLIPNNVGYNISYVDHVYLPVAIEPANNPYIGYSGSAMDISDFDSAINKFLTPDHVDRGWPVYNLAGPRRKLPGAYNVFAEREGREIKASDMPVQPVSGNPYTLATMTCINNAANGTQCSDADQAKPYGRAVQEMQNLWGYCVDWGEDKTWKDYVSHPDADPEQSCREMGTSPEMQRDLRLVYAFFHANYRTYDAAFGKEGSECRPTSTDKEVPFDFLQTIMHIYGWVPFNNGCNNAAFNPLSKTTVAFDGKTWTHAQVQPRYINDLQYNYKKPGNTDPIFNPYVKLIHEDLQMNAYGFSVDDSVGFMSELGSGLIFAVGSANGLPNPGQFSYTGGFSLQLGDPASVAFNQPLIKSYGVCVYPGKKVDRDECRNVEQNMTMPTDNKLVGFRIGTVSSYPIRVSFTDMDDNVYSFDVVEAFGGLGTRKPIDPNNPDAASYWPKNNEVLVKGLKDDCTITNANQAPTKDEVTRWCGGFDLNVSSDVGTKDPQTLKNHIGVPVPIKYLP